MQKYIINKVFLLYIIAVTLVSCTKKIDEAYLNPNADTKKPIEELLPGIIANMTINGSAQGSLYGTQNDLIYIGRYVQYWATNSSGNQYDQMGTATWNSFASIMGAHWAAHYYGAGNNLNKMIEWGIEEKKWDYVGVGFAIRAWSWLTLTNLHGEVILKTAFEDRLTFPYDSQEDVYSEVRRLCHISLAYLNKTGDNVSQTNLAKGDQYMNGGDVNKWKKFVYGVLARSFNQLTNKSEYNPDSVIHYCNLSISTNAENTTAKWSNSGVNHTYSYFSPFRGNLNALRQGRFIAELLSGSNPEFPLSINDPRAPYMLQENIAGTYRGIRPNKGTDGLSANDLPNNFYGGPWATSAPPPHDSTARYIFKNAPIWPIITASEIQFIKAEALYKKGDKASALAAYTRGINLNFDQLISDYEISVPVSKRMTISSKAAYLSNLNVIPTNPNNLSLSKIMLQKYIALYGWGGIETWVDLRRYHYDLDMENGNSVFRNFTPPPASELYVNNKQKVVQRCFPRGASEIYNLPELTKIGGNSTDYHTKECWFSQR